MKKPKHELMTFVAGIVMLVAGLFILSQKVIVSSSFFSSFGGLSIWGARVSSGSDSVDHWNCMDVYDRFICIKGFFCIGRTFDRNSSYFVNKYSSYQYDII